MKIKNNDLITLCTLAGCICLFIRPFLKAIFNESSIENIVFLVIQVITFSIIVFIRKNERENKKIYVFIFLLLIYFNIPSIFVNVDNMEILFIQVILIVAILVIYKMINSSYMRWK